MRIFYILTILLLMSALVFSQNQSPIAVNDTVTMVFGEEITVNVLANDYDPDGDSIRFSDIMFLYFDDSPNVISYTDSTITFLYLYEDLSFNITYIIQDENGNWNGGSGAEIVFVIKNEKYIDVNNISAMVHSFGNHFWDFSDSQFEFPKGSGKTPTFSNSLWMGGMDDQGDIYLAAETYRQNGSDYWTGPLSQEENVTIDSLTAGRWNKIWKINKAQVLYHKNHWDDANYEMPEVIATWPAHGDIDLGQAEYLAPFVDIDNDGEYHPEEGDYPLIRGDQTLFFIFNDLKEHTESEGDSLGVEIHGMFWGINDESKPHYNNTIFMSYKIFNRTDIDYTDFLIGLYTDGDIGDASDDYVSSDVKRGAFISYNGDNEDITYGVNPPAVATVILGGAYMDSDGSDNPSFQQESILGPSIEDCQIVSWDSLVQTLTYGEDNQLSGDFLVSANAINGVNFGDGIIDNERLGMSKFVSFTNHGGDSIGDPNQVEHYLNYMNGLWKDGSPLIYGGDGYSEGTVNPPLQCKYAYPNDSDPCNWGTDGFVPGDYNQGDTFWTEGGEGNTPDDRRGLQSIGPFTFKSGDVEIIDVAFVCAWDSINAYPASNNLLKSYIDSLRIDYMANSDNFGYDPALSIEKNKIENKGIKIFPNPSQNIINISMSERVQEGKIEIFDLSGRLIQQDYFKGECISQFGVEGLCSGFYTLRIISSEEIYVGKFIKE